MTEPGRWTWREASAIAAALVSGVLAGPFVLRSSQPLPFMSEGGRVIAVGSLDRALMSRAGGDQAQGEHAITIGLSFLTRDGQYCRSFALNPGPAGLACRERGDWIIEVLARNPRPRDGSAPSGYRQSGTPYPAAVRDAMQARLDGQLLAPAEEKNAISRRWKPMRVLKDTNP